MFEAQWKFEVKIEYDGTRNFFFEKKLYKMKNRN